MNVSEWDLIPEEKNHEKILDSRKVRARNASDKKKVYDILSYLEDFGHDSEPTLDPTTM